jgi:hypothetical protein
MGDGKSALTPERQRFLQEMGQVVADAFNLSVDENGVVQGATCTWTPLENQRPLDPLFTTMRMAGLEPSGFKFQQYDIIAANPYEGGRVDLPFPSQVVIKSDRYTGIHQVDLVFRNPFVTAVEIQGRLR